MTVYPQIIENLVVAQPFHTRYFYSNHFNHTRLGFYERWPAAMSESNCVVGILGHENKKKLSTLLVPTVLVPTPCFLWGN